MSIFTFPRLHFQGFARIHAPTGHKNGLVDLSNNNVYQDGKPFDLHRPISEYHQYLQQKGPQFNAQGQWDEAGAFSMAKGWDFEGNGHFAIEAQIVSIQRERGKIDRHDPVVGRSVDMWGHHNEYLGTTVNRARIFDCDPASNWTTTIMVGQLTFGRKGSSQEVPNMLSAPVEGLQPARWQNFDYIQELPEHCLNSEFKRASVHQFTVSKEAQDFFWGEEASLSPTVKLLKQAMDLDEVLGLAVQFGLSNMSAPTQPNAPSFWSLNGTIGLWCQGEISTYPHGRLLTPVSHFENSGDKPNGIAAKSKAKMLSNLSVRVDADGVSLNAIASVPCLGRASQSGPGPTHALGPKRDMGEWELRTRKTQQLVARIPQSAYQQEAYQLTSGIIDVPLATTWSDLRNSVEREGLCLIGTMADGQKQLLVREQEINLQIDDACLFVEFPERQNQNDYAVEVEVRSFVRGQPASVDAVYVRQYYNPKGFPQLRYEFENDPANANRAFHFPPSSELNILEFKPGKQTAAGDFSSSCTLFTNEDGCGWLTLRGQQAGTTRVLLSADLQDNPCNGDLPDEAEISYDNEDRLGFWAGAGSFAARVMGNDWHLDDIPTEEVDFDLIYREILAYYELCFSFMKAEVFSLADKCKVETYARLMWQMSDPRNRNKTYYMPPTRDMSQPKTMLLYKYLQNQQQVGYVPQATPVAKPTQRTIQTREELVVALRQAAELEVAVMLQYIYAAYSIPNHVTGQEYVRQGLWTPEQLTLACGDGREARNYGMRGVLLEISHEEMIHFLLVNNILMAMGEPFYPANPDFAKINQSFPLEVDLALEPLNMTSVQRFMRLEMPDFLEEDLIDDDRSSDDPMTDRFHSYGSLSELYRQIREAIANLPDLFLAKKGNVGGEHHIFLRSDFNQKHPDYQLQVDDVDSALFAVDLIAEQGEGCNADSPKFDKSHYQQFRRMAEALSQQQFAGENKLRPGLCWNPAYPALRNPTLHYQDRNTNVVTAAETRKVMQICNECYFLMMQIMVQHFGLMPNASLRRSKLMNAAIDLMTGMVRPLGELLTTMPSGKRGRTAGPSFAMVTSPAYIPKPEVAYTSIARRLEKLSDRAKECESISSAVREMLDFYTKFFDEMAQSSIAG
ncbi:MAG TPA: ferritin-like protein [Coleofasciculaceae cyanobacterium]|jgi:hypothetical protein